jgi:hypothetical protein
MGHPEGGRTCPAVRPSRSYSSDSRSNHLTGLLCVDLLVMNLRACFKHALRDELNMLGYPRAALFGFINDALFPQMGIEREGFRPGDFNRRKVRVIGVNQIIEFFRHYD